MSTNNIRHEHEKAQLCELFHQQKIDRFDDRFKIMEEFLNTEQHISTGELAERLRAKGYDFSFEFVRDTMLLLEKFGFAEHKHFPMECPEPPPHSHLHGHLIHPHRHDPLVHTKRWEHRHLGMHHDHMVCAKCNKIMEFNSPELEELQQKIAKEHHFHMLQHKMAIYGLCEDCFNARAVELSLTEIKPGERVRIVGFVGPKAAKMRLGNMGLRRGHELEVISVFTQNVVVVSQMQRIVLDCDLAGFIKVEPINTLQDC